MFETLNVPSQHFSHSTKLSDETGIGIKFVLLFQSLDQHLVLFRKLRYTRSTLRYSFFKSILNIEDTEQ